MKNRLDFATVLAVCIVLSLFSACVLAARGDDAANPKSAEKSKDVLAALEKAKENVASTYKLGYRFRPGETMRTKVVHLVTVESKIKGTAQNTKSRSVSTRAWIIREVDASGNITFDNVVEHVQMWNSVEGREEVHYDSAKDPTPPSGFENVATSIGKVLASIKIDPQGRILSRTNNQAQYNPGIGDLTVPFPPADKQPLKPGVTWSIPDVLSMPLDDGTIKKVQTQQQYKLDKVENGVATISVATTILTPINDPKLQSQLIQRLQRGTIKFDIDAGRLLHKQFDIDQQVFGFSGADSHMAYLARLTEEPIKDDLKSAAAQPKAVKK
jgi:hypothetical protein